jgi:hypothetical protein
LTKALFSIAMAISERRVTGVAGDMGYIVTVLVDERSVLMMTTSAEVSPRKEQLLSRLKQSRGACLECACKT